MLRDGQPVGNATSVLDRTAEVPTSAVQHLKCFAARLSGPCARSGLRRTVDRQVRAQVGSGTEVVIPICRMAEERRALRTSMRARRPCSGALVEAWTRGGRTPARQEATACHCLPENSKRRGTERARLQISCDVSAIASFCPRDGRIAHSPSSGSDIVDGARVPANPFRRSASTVKILVLSNIYPSPANPHAATFIRSRVEALTKLGHLVTPVGVGGIPHGADSLRPSTFLDGTIRVRHLDRALMRGGIARDKVTSQAASQVAGVLGANSFDLVMAHGMFALGAGAVAARLAGELRLPFSIHLHGSDVNHVIARCPKRAMPVLEAASAVITVSHALVERLAGLGYQGAVSVVPNGVNTDVFTADGPCLADLPDGRPRFLFVGNLVPVKGADRLPALLRLLSARWPECRLAVIGDGPLRAELAGSRDEKLVLLGRRGPDEVAQAMRGSDVLLLPSRSEGWPTVINEAYAVGTPVVGTSVGGIGEAIVDAGHLVPEAQILGPTWIEAVERALGWPSASLVQRAAEFEWSQVVTKELAALDQVL